MLLIWAESDFNVQCLYLAIWCNQQCALISRKTLFASALNLNKARGNQHVCVLCKQGVYMCACMCNVFRGCRLLMKGEIIVQL